MIAKVGRKLTVLEFHAFVQEVSHDWQDDRIILIVGSAIHTFQRIDPRQFLTESMQVPMELFRTVTRLESKPIGH